MEKFLEQEKGVDFYPSHISGYVSHTGEVYMSDPFRLWLKRVFDVFLSVLSIIFVLSWLFPIIALAVKISSSGPVLFMQRRHGKNNTVFYCYKFRTMRVNTEADTRQATKSDPRVTRVGRFLRRSSLDELPQLINVLKNEMSLIGPRPHAVPMNLVFAQEIENYSFRHSVKPGITGLAQSKGYRGEIEDFHDIYGRVKLDLFYIKKWCVLLDFKILFWTLQSIFSKNFKAY
jgi:putative colanic acid biosysnthesis UDP-glucose lipid carrier transferase